MNFWKKMPRARAAIPFILGIISTVILGASSRNYYIAILLFLFAIFLVLLRLPVSIRRNRIISLGLTSLLFLAGAIRGELQIKHNAKNTLTKSELAISSGYLLEIKGSPIEKEKSFKLDVVIIGKLINNQLIPHCEKSIVYVSKEVINESLLQANSIFTFKSPASIAPPKNPREFDYKEYLLRRGISYQFYLQKNDFKIASSKKQEKFYNHIHDFREYNLIRLEKLGLKGNELAVVSALVFGQKDLLDSKLHNDYSAAGVTHILAVSGLHVGLIFLILLKCTKKIRSKGLFGNWFSFFFLLFGIWCYAIITGLSPSVLRASTMFSFIAFAKIFKNGSNVYNTLATSAIVLLIISPYLIMEVGFQLSYAAVLGILIAQPFLYGLFNFSTTLIDRIWQLTTVSIAAQLGTFPLALLYFHQFPNYFIISNLLVIPLATVILYCSFAVIACQWVIPLAKFLTLLLSKTVQLLNFFVEQVRLLPHAQTKGIDISILECSLIYLFIAISLGTLIHRKFGWIKWNLGILILLCVLQCIESKNQYEQSGLTIHVIRNERAISIFDGRTCYFLCSKALWSDRNKIKFHLQNYWDQKGILKMIHVDIENTDYHCNAFIKNENILCYKEKTIILFQTNGENFSFSKNSLLLLDEIEKNKKYSDDILLIADGKTKSKYLLKKMKNEDLLQLESALHIQ